MNGKFSGGPGRGFVGGGVCGGGYPLCKGECSVWLSDVASSCGGLPSTALGGVALEALGIMREPNPVVSS